MLEVFKGLLGNFMVDSDGRRAVGRSIDNHADLQRGEELQVDGIKVNKKVLETKYEDKIQEISLLERRITTLQKKYKGAKHRHDFLKRTSTAQILLWGAIGLYMGLVASTSKMLEVHGPTVTIVGTLGASLVYLISGAFFAGLMIWLCREQLKDFIRYNGVKAHKYKAAIIATEEQLEAAKKEASRLIDRAYRDEEL